MKQTEFTNLLQASRFDDARKLLERELVGGRLLDPRCDVYWTTFADNLANAIGQTSKDNVIDFWQALRDFFINTIEPMWGHAHKGHLYFRLGLAVLPRDLTRGKAELENAYKEDLALEAKKGGTQAEIEERSRRYSAYVALTILERIEEGEFANQADKEYFIKRLFESFDVAIARGTVRPDIVDDAVKAIAAPQVLPLCLALYRELQEANLREMAYATVSLTGTVLEAHILADLYYRKGIAQLPNGKELLHVELGPLLEEAIRRSIFTRDSVRVAFQLVHFFRNRLHTGNEVRQKYRLTHRVAWTIKVFFDLALLEWREAFR